jgi:hypothetical protein
MIAVVPKFQYFQMFVNHKDMQFDNGNIDDVVITGSPVLPAVLSPGSNTFQASKPDIVGHEPRRSRRKLMEEEAPNCTDNDNADSDSEDSEYDEEWVDSDNEVAEDDDDLYEEWVDDKLEEKIRSKSKLDQDSDYDTDLEELQVSDIEEEDSADKVEVVDQQGRKKKKKKSEAEKVEAREHERS